MFLFNNPTLMERLDCSSSSLVIIGAFVDALIPLDADGEAKKMSEKAFR